MPKISELPSVTTAAAADALPVVQSGTTKKATMQDYIDDVLGVSKTGGTVTGPLITAPASEPAIWLEYNPAEATEKNWYFRFGTPTTNAGDGTRKDVVFLWGYNAAANGGAQVPGELAWYLQMEPYYAPTASSRVAEYHLNFWNELGVSIGRPFHINAHLNSDTDYPNTFTHEYKGRVFTWTNMSGSFNPFQVFAGTNAAASTINLYAPTIVRDLQTFYLYGGTLGVLSQTQIRGITIAADDNGTISIGASSGSTHNLYFNGFSGIVLPGVILYPTLSDFSVHVNVASGKVYKVNSVQVVGARVIDARCDDTVSSGDATTDGVIDALRDAMISHGLIAAA